MSVAVSGSSPQIKYEGVVGGNVTFYCPVKHPEKLQFLYLQKGNDFVNGYYHTRDVPSPWSNTKMDHSNTAIRMYGLNLSHTGEYDCLYMYNDNTAEHMSVKLHLSITATFSKPKITKRCKDDDVPVGCYVTCTSHSGYPSQKITWQTEHGHSQMWKELNNSEVLSNPTTKMINVSSTGYMNCSSGEMMVTCSVGNISSVKISVCE
ncbi:CD276 antigen-like [Nematolebias whitei]|uniref:CD276 antigen-like n=1 Tax=Nematolebias whitei TaxID=451745 RepID=UPI0018996682|nr:CD276 antigen-like [Nematolebias whitei]